MKDSTVREEMHSLEFKDWIPFIKLSLADIPNAGGDCDRLAAVYAMRDARTGDILKYGKSKEIRGRIYANYIGGWGGATTQRVYRELFGAHRMINHVETAWIPTKNDDEALKLEKQFRAEYKKRTGNAGQRTGRTCQLLLKILTSIN